jgi:hypothetical protein
MRYGAEMTELKEHVESLICVSNNINMIVKMLENELDDYDLAQLRQDAESLRELAPKLNQIMEMCNE